MNSNKSYNFIFTSLFPFWTMILSISKFKASGAKNLFWYGCAYLGVVHIFNPIGGSGSDGIRYAYALVQMHNSKLDFETISNLFYAEGGKLDIYQPLITFVVSLFTSNAHYLFLIYAIVFGYFYSRNIWIVLEKCKFDKIKSWVWIFALSYILVNPIWNINGVRMWTALQVFIYGIMSVTIQDNKRGNIYLFLSCFIHFSFIIPVLIYYLYLFLPKKSIHVYFIIFYCCVLFSELDIASFRDKIYNYVPIQLTDKIDSYMGDQKIEDFETRESPFAFHVILAKNLGRYYLLISLLVLWISFKNICNELIEKNILMLLLVFGSIIEVFSGIPSFGRFSLITSALFYALVLLLLFNHNLVHTKFIGYFKYSGIILIYPIVFKLRAGLDYYGISAFCGNFISAILIDDRYPVIKFLKSIL
jgi:hypothetical protein